MTGVDNFEINCVHTVAESYAFFTFNVIKTKLLEIITIIINKIKIRFDFIYIYI